MDSLILEPSPEAAVGEVTELYVKGIHLLILKHQPKGQGLAGPFSGDRALVSASSALPLYSTFLAQAGGSGHNFTEAAGIAHPQCSFPSSRKEHTCPAASTLHHL